MMTRARTTLLRLFFGFFATTGFGFTTGGFCDMRSAAISWHQ
jgi:hypothetical protein